MITPATAKDHPAIVEIWERSVRATHHFLPEEYLLEIKTLLPSILPQVEVYVWKNEGGHVKGFTGVAGQKMEMLFIHPDSMGKGLGRKLAEFCIKELGADEVDVNEQNEQAVGFYKKIGYRQTGREALDSMQRPYPILQMRYVP